MGNTILSRTVILDESAIAAKDLDAAFGSDHVSEAMMAVRLDGDGKADFVASNGDKARGFAMRKCGKGEPVQIMTEGKGPVKVKTASGIEQYSPLRANDDGTVSLATPGDEVVAKADDNPDADGDIIQARISAWAFVSTEPST